jgi:hypothetical protein
MCAGAVAQCYISTVMHRDMTRHETSILRGVSVLLELACVGSESIGGSDPCPSRGESLLEAATHLKKMQLVGAYWHTVCLHTTPCLRWPCACVNIPITYQPSLASIQFGLASCVVTQLYPPQWVALGLSYAHLPSLNPIL